MRGGNRGNSGIGVQRGSGRGRGSGLRLRDGSCCSAGMGFRLRNGSCREQVVESHELLRQHGQRSEGRGKRGRALQNVEE